MHDEDEKNPEAGRSHGKRPAYANMQLVNDRVIGDQRTWTFVGSEWTIFPLRNNNQYKTDLPRGSPKWKSGSVIVQTIQVPGSRRRWLDYPGRWSRRIVVRR